MRVALQQVFCELLQSSKVALTLPRVVVRALWKDSKTFSPRGRQIIKLFHHDGGDELVRQTGHKQRGHAAQRDLSIGQELIPVAPQGQQAHGQEGEECSRHVGDAEEGVFNNDGGYAVRVDRRQAHGHGTPQRAAKEHDLCLVQVRAGHDVVQRGLGIQEQPVLAGLAVALPVAAVVHQHHIGFQIDQHQQGVWHPVANITCITMEIKDGRRSRGSGAALIARVDSRRLVASCVAEQDEVKLHTVLGANVHVFMGDSRWHGNIKARGGGLVGEIEEHVLKLVENACHRGQDKSQEEESPIQVEGEDEGQKRDSTSTPGPGGQSQGATLDRPPQPPGLLHGDPRAESDDTHSSSHFFSTSAA